MVDKEQTSLAQQLLELTQKMLNNGQTFSINLKMTNFNFYASTKDKESPNQEVKKVKHKSPSQKKRDFLRKQIFQKKKLECPSSPKHSEKQDMFTCEHCDYKNIKKRGLDTHVRQKHKTLPETPEILRSKPIFQEKSPTLSVSSEPRIEENFLNI